MWLATRVTTGLGGVSRRAHSSSMLVSRAPGTSMDDNRALASLSRIRFDPAQLAYGRRTVLENQLAGSCKPMTKTESEVEQGDSPCFRNMEQPGLRDTTRRVCEGSSR